MEESALLFDKKGRKKKLYAEINDGYSIRCLVEFLYAAVGEINIVFNRRGISIRKADAENLILIDVWIDKGKIPYYMYWATEDEIIFGTSLETLRADTQVLAKKEGIKLTMYENDKSLYFEPIGSDSSTDSLKGLSKIKHKKVPNTRYPIPEYKTPESDPTCAIAVNKFCKMCTKFNKVRNTNTILMKAYPAGIKFRSSNPGKIRNNTHCFGIISEIKVKKEAETPSKKEDKTELKSDENKEKEEKKEDNSDGDQPKKKKIAAKGEDTETKSKNKKSIKNQSDSEEETEGLKETKEVKELKETEKKGKKNEKNKKNKDSDEDTPKKKKVTKKKDDEKNELSKKEKKEDKKKSKKKDESEDEASEEEKSETEPGADDKSENEEDEVDKVHISKFIFKAMTKLPNISTQNATCGLIYERSLPVKVFFSIGTIGMLRCYINSDNPE